MSHKALNSNQIEMLVKLYDAKSSKENPVNLNTMYGFRANPDEDSPRAERYTDESLQKLYDRNQNKLHADYIEISTHGGGLGYIDHEGDFGWITEAGKKIVEEMRQKIKDKIKRK